MCSLLSYNFKLWLNGIFLVLSNQSKMNGEENFALFLIFLVKLALPIVAAPHTHKQQEAVERRHRHTTETGLSFLAHGSVPMSYWHYAFETAVFLINRMPTKVSSGVSPFKLVYNKPPSYAFLRIFGCLFYPFLRPYNRHKMKYRSQPYVFLSYSPSYSAYRCLDLKTNHTYIARHVRFDESTFSFQSQSSLNYPPPLSPFSPSWGVTSLQTLQEATPLPSVPPSVPHFLFIVYPPHHRLHPPCLGLPQHLFL